MVKCPKGFILTYDENGNRVPFLIPTRQDDIIWNDLKDEEIIAILNNNTSVTVNNPEPTYSFESVKHFDGNKTYTWDCDINLDGKVSGSTSVSMRFFNYDYDANLGTYDVELPTEVNSSSLFINLSIETDVPELMKSMVTFHPIITNDKVSTIRVNIYYLEDNVELIGMDTSNVHILFKGLI